MTQMAVSETLVRFITVSGVGGFPVDNIAYWRMESSYNNDGDKTESLMVYFRTGGFVSIPDMSAEEFATFVYGTNPPF